MARSRNSLRVDECYYENKSGLYFLTPDGVGIYWYDTLLDYIDQHGEPDNIYCIDEVLDY